MFYTQFSDGYCISNLIRVNVEIYCLAEETIAKILAMAINKISPLKMVVSYAFITSTTLLRSCANFMSKKYMYHLWEKKYRTFNKERGLIFAIT